MTELSMEERIIAGLFLCSSSADAMLAALRQEWALQSTLHLSGKLNLLQPAAELQTVFPWQQELSDLITYADFAASFFVQPSLFLRIRPGKKDTVTAQLADAGIKYEAMTTDCLALPPGTKADEVLAMNRDVVVQDYSSQQIGPFIEAAKLTTSAAGTSGAAMTVWDCCAASGGKSILAYDLLKNIELTVSDIRESVLANLKKRFGQAGIENYRSFITNLAAGDGATVFPSGNKRNTFDLVMADVPCSGSGTWSRTPEQLYYFNPEKIKEYSALQKKIVSQAVNFVKPAGFFLYSTCSVFKKENEEVVHFLQEKFHLRLVKMELIKGYDKKADTMFAALLQR